MAAGLVKEKIVTQKRSFLFLQGPHGPFFKQLGRALRAQGHTVSRINFNPGDVLDWMGRGSYCYFGRPKNFITYLDKFVLTHHVTDLVLYGDCRPLHKEAIQFFRDRGARVHIFEEGYIRPHWVTYEREGVNGHSSIKKLLESQNFIVPKKKAYFSTDLGHTTRNLIFYCLRYYAPQWAAFYTFPFARTHRKMASFPEAMLWVRRLLKLKRIKRKADKQTFEFLETQKPYFLLPLQLDSDYQIRVHSPFSSMLDAIWKIMDSFAQHASSEDVLVLKNHPLDVGCIPYAKEIERMAKDLRIEGRVIYIDGGPFHDLVKNAKAMVVINSTSGFQAMRHKVPTKVLGNAIYDLPGLAASQSFDDFWKEQDPIDISYYRSVREVLLNTCQINGSFYTKCGRHLLCRRLVELLPAEELKGVTRVELSNRKSKSKDRVRSVRSKSKKASISFF